MKTPVGIPAALRIAVLALAILTAAVAAAYADGGFKEKLREKLLQKLQDAPAPAANASVNERITKPGDYRFTIQHGGMDRYYIVHVPRGYDAAKPAALLFALHGGGGDMEYMANDGYYGIISKSDALGFVAVFPNGYSNFRSGKLATWNAGDCCGDARDGKVDDVGFIRAIVGNVTRQMNIDAGRVYATGMSNGGMMSERLACDMADVFKAIASVAGPDGTLQCDPQKPVSVLQIHALDDDHVKFDGGVGPAFMKQTLGKVADFRSVPATVAGWVKRDRCPSPPKRVLQAEGAYCDLYAPCAGGAKVQLCVTEKGAHSWPGGKKTAGIMKFRKEPNSQAISANDEMWKFFNSLP